MRLITSGAATAVYTLDRYIDYRGPLIVITNMLCCIVGAAAAAITGAVNIKNMGHRPLCKRGTRPQQIYL